MVVPYTIATVLNMKSKTHSQSTVSPANSLTTTGSMVLYLAAFIEGGAVMSIELAGAKMIAPYYGTSLYVWASVLAVTLGGLTLGYFLGGWATYRFQAQQLLFWELLIGSIAVCIMPVLALKIMPATASLGLRLGSLVSAIAFMALPLACMGMVSPTIIQLNNKELQSTGKTAGRVYAISTVGGIIMTLLMGFLLLPEWGVRTSLYFTTVLLGITPLILTLTFNKNKILTVTNLLAVSFCMIALQSPFKIPKTSYKFLYKNDGILGQLAVLENPDGETNRTYHHLFINHIPQTWVDVRFMPISEWSYPHRLSTVAGIKAPGSKALLIGMGGGSIAMEFKKMDFDLDIVELDKRIPKVAEKYFGFNPKDINIYVDDGRHFLHTTPKVYDIIDIDVINGEVQPTHLFTMESFAEIKKIIKPDGIIIINLQGYLKGEHGKGNRSIYKTLLKSGFKVKYYNGGDMGDIHFFASLQDLNYQINFARLNECCRRWNSNIGEAIISNDQLDTLDAVTFTDDKPQLELLNNLIAEAWRSKVISEEGVLKRQERNHIPFFY